MKYILGLIFEYKYYRSPCNIKIYSGDIFLDDIDLDKSIPLTEQNENKDSKALLNENVKLANEYLLARNVENHSTKFSFANKVFLYEIDDSVLSDKIVLKTTNDNNNYTNGFMTEYSYINVEHIFLLPTQYFQNFKKLHDKVLRYQEKQKVSKKTIKDNCNYFDYPGDLRLYDPVEDDYDPDVGHGMTKGGSFVLDLPIKYVDGTHMLVPKHFPTKYINDCEIELSATFLSYYAQTNLLNIYNEDQRSNSTKD